LVWGNYFELSQGVAACYISTDSGLAVWRANDGDKEVLHGKIWQTFCPKEKAAAKARVAPVFMFLFGEHVWQKNYLIAKFAWPRLLNLHGFARFPINKLGHVGYSFTVLNEKDTTLLDIVATESIIKVVLPEPATIAQTLCATPLDNGPFFGDILPHTNYGFPGLKGPVDTFDLPGKTPAMPKLADGSPSGTALLAYDALGNPAGKPWSGTSVLYPDPRQFISGLEDNFFVKAMPVALAWTTPCDPTVGSDEEIAKCKQILADQQAQWKLPKFVWGWYGIGS